VRDLQAKPTIAGVILILLGFVASIYGSRTYLRDVPRTVTDTFHVGQDVRDDSYWSHPYHFEPSTVVVGNITVSDAATGQSSSINFFVLDRTNFESWRQRQPGVQYLVKMLQAQSSFNFSFTTPRNDTYHFVFDNYYSTARKNISLGVRYEYVKISREPYTDHTAAYGGVVLAVVGTTVLAYGLLKKPEIRWA